MALASAFRTRPTVEGGIPADFPSQVGRGEAQLVPKGRLTDIIEQQAQRRAAEEESERQRKERLEKELEVKKPNLLPRDEKRYQEMSADYYEDKINNINNLNDPEVKARLKQKKQQLVDFGMKSVSLHKEVIRRSAASAKGVWVNTENFDQLLDPSYIGKESDYLEQYVSGQKLLGDITEKVEPFDLDQDFRLNVLRPMNQAKDRRQTSMTLDDGTVITTKIEELTAEEARAIAGQRYLHAPVKEAADAQYEALPPETQAQYDGPEDYYVTSRTLPFIGIERFQRRTKADPKRDFVWGAGRVSSNKWTFVDTVLVETETDWDRFLQLTTEEDRAFYGGLASELNTIEKERIKKEGKGKKIHTVRIQNIGTEAENKPISIQVDKQGSRVFAFPIAWRYEEGKEDEAKLIIGQKVGVGADAEWRIDEISAKISSGDIEAITSPPGKPGMTLDRFIKEAGTAPPEGSVKYNYGGKTFTYQQLVDKYGKDKADAHIQAGTFKAQ